MCFVELQGQSWELVNKAYSLGAVLFVHSLRGDEEGGTPLARWVKLTPMTSGVTAGLSIHPGILNS